MTNIKSRVFKLPLMSISNISEHNLEQAESPNQSDVSIEWLILRNRELEKSNHLLIEEIIELRRLEMIRKNYALSFDIQNIYKI
jgi:hypothetical protein